jgi:serine/threonine protein kinase
LHHPNIVQFLGSHTTPDGEQYMVFEFLKNGSLLQRIQGKTTFTMEQNIRILTDVCKAR